MEYGHKRQFMNFYLARNRIKYIIKLPGHKYPGNSKKIMK